MPRLIPGPDGRKMLAADPHDWLSHPWGTDASADGRLALFVGGPNGAAEVAAVRAAVEKAEAAVAATESRDFKDAKVAVVVRNDAREQAVGPAADEAVHALAAVSKRLARAAADHPVSATRPLEPNEHPTARGVDAGKPATVGSMFEALATMRALDSETTRVLALDPVSVPGEIRDAVREKRWATLFAIDGAVPRMKHVGSDIREALAAARIAYRETIHDRPSDRTRLSRAGLAEVVQHVRDIADVAAARLERIAPPVAAQGIGRRVRRAFNVEQTAVQTVDDLLASIEERTTK